MRVFDYFLLPNRPLRIEFVPDLITELRALVAALLAIVFPLAVFPPKTEFIALVLTLLATDEAALDTALCAAFETASFFLFASFSAFAASLLTYRICFLTYLERHSRDILS